MAPDPDGIDDHQDEGGCRGQDQRGGFSAQGLSLCFFVGENGERIIQTVKYDAWNQAAAFMKKNDQRETHPGGKQNLDQGCGQILPAEQIYDMADSEGNG